MEFPICKTKIEGLDKKFALTDPDARKEYFRAKAGDEINKLNNFLEENSFIAYMLGKKNSGKGTYAKMLKEALGTDKIEHLSIGDMVRDFNKDIKDKEKKNELIVFLEKNYRGYLPLKDIIKSLEERSVKTLLPSELVLALAKKKIAEKEKRTLFLDGFPREMDQISYSLFFRDLIGHREDSDFFILIDVPEEIIDERIKYRRICPNCQTSRNLKLLPTKDIGYDEEKQEFYLLCDNPECENVRMVQKEGDEMGVEPIKPRLEKDQKLMEKAFSLYGIPKILLRNDIPVENKDDVDDYELTPSYKYKKKENGEIETIESSWIIKNEEGDKFYSLMPPPVVVSLIKQLVYKLNL